MNTDRIGPYALAACLITAAAGATATAPARADDFVSRVIADELQRPTGILLDAVDGELYFTQLPTPGIGGDDGGMNTVSVLDLRSGAVSNVSEGEPEPTNLAMAADGMLYWTCKSAGVILSKREGEDKAVFLENLAEPSGIAVRGPFLVFTEIPEPGIMDGANAVKATRRDDPSMIETLSKGEPEPTDVAVDSAGNVYWTCKSAGVILWRAPNGTVTKLLENLESPTGIAVDAMGRLYYTEVPTPGVGGDDGGRNRITRYDPASGESTLVNEGDPEPTDITVSAGGRFVFWTCTSAGVIVAAREN